MKVECLSVLLQATALLSRHTCVQLLDMTGLVLGLSDGQLMRRMARGLQQLHTLQFCHVGVLDKTVSSLSLEVISHSLPSLRTLVLEGASLHFGPVDTGERRSRLQHRVCLSLSRALPLVNQQQL
jgi:hypothetical protein